MEKLRLSSCGSIIKKVVLNFFYRRSSYPAIDIGYLGTSVNGQSKGIGQQLSTLWPTHLLGVVKRDVNL